MQKMQVFITAKLLYMFGLLSTPSSGVHQTVTQLLVQVQSVSGQRPSVLIMPRWQKVVALIRDMTCTRRCSYSFYVHLMMGAIDARNM